MTSRRVWSRPVAIAAVRRWWPVPVIVATALVAQGVLLGSRYDVGGHAAEHLASAAAPFLAAAAVGLLLWSTPAARRQPVVLAALGAWLAATVAVLVGNVRVVDTLIAAGMASTPTGELVDSAEVAAAHGLANAAPWWAVLAALAVCGVLWRHRHVSGRAALVAAVLSVVFPPWIVPGAGVPVLAAVRTVAFARRRPRPDPVPERVA